MSKSNIEWTDETWNPVSGCSPAGPGCLNCYAVPMTYRLETMGQTKKYGGLTVLNGDKREFTGEVRTHKDALAIPYHMKKPKKIFVNSMSDLFHPHVPQPFISECYTTMWQANHHIYQILTKRGPLLAEFYRRNYGSPPMPGRRPPEALAFSYRAIEDDWEVICRHIWHGVSCAVQADLDAQAPHLLRVPGNRFLSLEPILGYITIPSEILSKLHLVIVGGESHGRQTNIDNVLFVMHQCEVAGVPCFIKQLGTFPVTENINLYDWDDDEDERFLPWGTCVASCAIKMEDPKGGNIEEWPLNLRRRQWPRMFSNGYEWVDGEARAV